MAAEACGVDRKISSISQIRYSARGQIISELRRASPDVAVSGAYGTAAAQKKRAVAIQDFEIMSKKFAQLANYVAGASGSAGVLAAAVLTVLLWLVTGPFFAYSDTWRLVMNTWTIVITFLMVFVIHYSQNRASAALQAKIDELVIRVREARDTSVGIEQLTPEEIEQIRQRVPGQVGEEAKGHDRRWVAPD
jgi:low affinity Fe/Cu permease